LTDDQPTTEERILTLEKRQIEMAKALVRLAKILKSLHPDSDITEGGFGLGEDEEDQIDELETGFGEPGDLDDDDP
jgi:hypothetical protein